MSKEDHSMRTATLIFNGGFAFGLALGATVLALL